MRQLGMVERHLLRHMHRVHFEEGHQARWPAFAAHQRIVHGKRGQNMEIEFERMDNGISKVLLRGRMDVLGVQAIDMKFTALTATQAALVLVDLSEVSFLASLGMRTLISSAKALAQRGGHMVLANPQANVLEVMKVSGLSSVIPVLQHVDDAVQALANFQSK